MDETGRSHDHESKPQPFRWHLTREELLAMPEEERAVYLNEKTSRLYEAMSTISRAEGAHVSRQDIEFILNPEEMEERQQNPEDIGSR